ncbi:hypothetical protein ACMGE7_08300 [Macrococcus equi]|uniref:hypothetical protein n=1 Tax=Macrococcus equi TaxID=3395462 RepID=UPI0039BE1C4D
MKFIETFTSEQPLHGKIEQLREEGIDPRDLYIISKNKIEGLSIIDQDVNYISADRNTADNVKSFFTGNDVESHHYDTHQLSGLSKEDYKRALDAGQLLLFMKALGE